LILASTASDAADIKIIPCGPGGVLLGYSDCITINGPIDLLDYGKFFTAKERVPQGIVYLNSPGGNVVGGMGIIIMILQRGYTTVVWDDAVCASMCANIWLAGKRRFLAPNAHLGFHSTWTRGGLRSEEGNANVRRYYEIVGLSRGTIDILLAADPRDMLWLTPDSSKTLGIVYEDWPPEPAAPPPHKPSVSTATLGNPEIVKKVKTLPIINPEAPPRTSPRNPSDYSVVDDPLLLPLPDDPTLPDASPRERVDRSFKGDFAPGVRKRP
jgi:hypothetical protein